MMMFFLTISCLTTSNLPWFMDLTFHILMQYTSLQHWILLSSPDTSTNECRFRFGQLLHSFWNISRCPPLFPSSTLATFWLEGSSSGVIPFWLFIQFMGISQLVYCSGLPFPPPVDHILSELSTVTHPSWVALHSMAHSFIEAFCHNKVMIHDGETD